MPMIQQIRRGVAWTAKHAGSFGGDPDRVYVVGSLLRAPIWAVAC